MPDMQQLIHYATMAPSGHNTQAWIFRIKQEDMIRICPDLTRSLHVVDPQDRELYISIGCALENLVIAAAHQGYEASPAPLSGNGSVDVLLKPVSYKAINKVLFDAIPERQSTRSRYDGSPIPKAELQKLSSFPLEEGVRAIIVTEPEKIERIIGLVRDGNNIQMNNPAFMQELISWIRFNRKEVDMYRDGLSFEATGSPHVPRTVGKLFVKLFLNARTQSKKDENNIRSSSALLAVVSENNDIDSWIRTGRSFERLALYATSLGIKNAHINQPCEVPELKDRLQELLSLGSRHPQLLLRLGYAKKLPGSPRRDVDELVR
ncbi:MAG: hypothetical protein QCH31_05980 [Methanolobus sp.]|nr:hypothetical protein [Methanolobus sp.]